MALPHYVSMGFNLTDTSISLMRSGIRVDRATELPPTGVKAIFSVSGRIMLLGVIGEVTTIMGAVATNLKIQSNPTVGTTIDLCAVAALNDLAVGILLSITGLATDPLKTGLAVPGVSTPMILSTGTIDMNATAAVGSGSVKWSCHYVPMDDVAVVTAL